MTLILLIRSQTLLTLSNTLKITFRGINVKIEPKQDVLHFYRNIFDISEAEAAYLFKSCPRLKIIEYERVPEAVQVLSSFGFDRETMLTNPKLLSIPPSSIKAHCNVLLECGMKLNPKYIINYNTYISKISVGKLIKDGDLPKYDNIYKKLMNEFSDFPLDDYLDQYENDILNTTNLCTVRKTVMQKYVTWKLDLDESMFQKFYNTYFQFKHRPLKDIEMSITIALNEIKLSKKKIQTYPYVLSSNPHNTRKIIDRVCEIGGTDILQILQIYPGIIRTDYKTILEIKKILVNNGYQEKYHRNALHIYTFSPETIRSRLKELKKNVVFNSLSASERLLLLVVYKNKFMKRLDILNKINKQCPRIQIFVAADEIFERYTKSFGDRSYDKEVISKINEILSIRKKAKLKEDYEYLKVYIERHCFYLCVPLLSVIGVINTLFQQYTKEEIRKNVHIVFYSWDLIHKHLEYIKIAKEIQEMSNLNETNLNESFPYQNINLKLIKFKNLTNSQALSLVLYLIEKDHFFTGDGIWNEQLCKDTFLEHL